MENELVNEFEEQNYELISQHDNLPPTVLVIFGVTGNLSSSKLLPALYNLLRRNMLPEKFKVVGIFRSSSKNLDNLLQQVEINLLRSHQDVDNDIMIKLKNLITPITMDSTNPAEYESLRALLDDLDREAGLAFQRLFYLAIPPDIFNVVISNLNQVGLNKEDGKAARRILVEKPFGRDLASAKELIDSMLKLFNETQIYRIDHYLAKENVQNILAFRFNNPLIEGIWDRQFIDHIQISAMEKIGIDSRSNFYEGMGALRDIVQSHLLQLLALVMMDVPVGMTSESIHAEKQLLLQSIEPIKEAHVSELSVRGQYEGYTDEVQNPDSTTETYAALCLEVANSRWGGIPVLLRTGKELDKKCTEIKIVFKDRSRRNLQPNLLTIRIQPNEGISILLTAKKPGFKDEIQPVNMEFNYRDNFHPDTPDAYERVLVDCIIGDQSLFASHEEVLRSWEILQPILDYWQKSSEKPEVYAKGSDGPKSADELAASYGTEWY